MKRETKIIGVLGITLLIGIAIYFLVITNNSATAPERHSSIPQEAIWYGGPDGGTWVIVNEGDSINTFKIKVYNESNGSLWADGVFTISENCSDTVLRVEDVRKLIEGFDGKNLILSEIKQAKHCTLVPVKIIF